jgi:hypothetical protein
MPMPAATVHRPVVPDLYGVSTVDNHGRIAARTLLHLLRWEPGDTIVFSISEQQVITATRASPKIDSAAPARTIRQRGHLHLPANIRHRAALTTGDRLLLAADRIGTLRIFPAQLLAQILNQHQTSRQP